MLRPKRQNSFLKQEWDRGTPEFDRVTNLSDAVFAIVMTLLVLTIGVPDVPQEQLAGKLLEHLPQVIVFVLSFALVANMWWQHHRFIDMLGSLEPGLMGMNLVLLGMIALVPFLTNLVGNSPTARAAVLPFIGLFAFITLMYLLMAVRAHRADAWRRPLTSRLFHWHVGRLGAGIVVVLISLVLAVRWPMAGLIVLGVTLVFGPLASLLTYRE